MSKYDSNNNAERTLTYTYGYDHQRVHMEERVGGNVYRTKTYVGNSEYIYDTDCRRSLTYLSAPTGLFAVYIREGSQYLNDEDPVSQRLLYLHTDHLGSITTITYGYMLGGAAVGFASGYVGATVCAGGGFMANTAGLIGSSMVNMAGTTMLSGGSYIAPISFGAASFDLMTGEWGYLGKKGNFPWQNIGYAFGALANVQDVVAGVNGTNIQVKSRKELAGHSELGSYSNNGNYQDGDILVSVGPNAVVGSSDYDVLLAMENKISIPTDDGVAWELPFVKATLKGKSVSGINEQIILSDDSQFITTINNVNGKILHNMTNNLNAGRNLINTGNLKYGLFYGCVNYTSRALAMSGVLNVNAFLPVTAPVLLNLELAIRNIGIYASPYLIQY